MIKFNNIDDNIKIDFAVPKGLQEMFKEAEEADLRDDGTYYDIADDIDVTCKNMNAAGVMSKKHWGLICMRYKLW